MTRDELYQAWFDANDEAQAARNNLDETKCQQMFEYARTVWAKIMEYESTHPTHTGNLIN
jgi:hypothetical protein